jgi:enoyl-CoA hydratase
MVRGDRLTMEEARDIGLVNWLLPAEEFAREAIDLARSFCPPGKASRAVGAIKRAVQTGHDLGLEAGLALERELQQQLFTSDDAREGLRAFVESRAPRFRGK